MYQKYVDWIVRCAPPQGRILDAGCGIGYVVNDLAAKGFDASGVDANAISLQKAQQGSGKFYLASDYRLPFEDDTFDVVGSYTVLEHIGDPNLFLREQVRVLRPGGAIIVGCPNFMQVVGLVSHHPRTRGAARKVANAGILLKKAMRYALKGDYEFEMMEPIVREIFEPDDDAIVATNAIDVCGALRSFGARIEHLSGTDHYQGQILERVGSLPVFRSIVGGVFVVARKTRRSSGA
ncbi:MAG TPA: class I SAM-dependent methyltransferase [Candidatus Baltobacteraceae bacterium]|nr:class I SAM-dependent methyltransferase [Candidatus Baltobacteraceae bacterium]